MSEEGKKKKLDNLVYWTKGQSGNPNGRPRKLVSIIKDLGYTKTDVITTIENMMAMTLSELAEIYKDEDSTILERTVANAMKKSLERGSLYSLEVLISRVHGQPKIETDNTNKNIEQPLFTPIKKENENGSS